MWFTNITKDIGEITSSFVEDTRNLANIVTRFATEVTGGDVLIAGDEDSRLAQQCPLSDTDIASFQRNSMVFLDDISEDEKASFDVWAKESEFKSQPLPQRREGHAELLPGSRYEKLATFRQQLLDTNPFVKKRYAAFVLSDERRHQKGGAEAIEHKRDEQVDTAAEHMEKDEIAPLDETLRITEDVFFDRYFFRLSQLRLRLAAERKQREEATKKEELEVNGIDQWSKGGLKAFTQRIVEAADGLINWDDENRERSGESQRTKSECETQENTIAALQSVVQALQSELWSEKRKLAAVLEVARNCGLSEEQQRLLREAAQNEEHSGNAPVRSSVCELELTGSGRKSMSVRSKGGDKESRGGSVDGRESRKNEDGADGNVKVSSKAASEGDNNESSSGVQFFVDNDGWTNVK